MSLPALAEVETALLNHWPAVTSENWFSVAQWASRNSSVISRKKMVAASARVMLARGRMVPSP